MSHKTLVLYLENDELKNSLKKQAMKEGLSLSRYVSNILSNNLNAKMPKNKLLKHLGALQNMSAEQWQEINQNMESFRNSFTLNIGDREQDQK